MKQHRYKELADALGLSINQFEKEIGVKTSRIAKAVAQDYGVTTDIVLMITSKYPKVNEHWLRTGEGSMFLSTSDKIHEMSKAGFPKPNKWERLLSLPFEIIKGKPTTAEDTKTISDYLSELSEAQKEFEDLQKELDELKKNRNKDK